MWDAGWALEQCVLDAMARDGWEIDKPDFGDSVMHLDGATFDRSDGRKVDLVLTCHPDAYVKYQDQWVVCDVKTRNDGAFNQWKTLGAVRSHPWDVLQLAIYTKAAFGEFRPAILACMNMNERIYDTDELTADDLDRAYRRGLARLAVMADQMGQTDEDKAPGRDYPADSWQCRYCAFRQSCRPIGSPMDLELAPDPPDEAEALVALAEYERAEAVLANWDVEIKPWESRRDIAKAALLAFITGPRQGRLWPVGRPAVDRARPDPQGPAATGQPVVGRP